METVVVIGGGAAGIMAALSAAEADRRVIIIERQQRIGRKLLATGNGRCNLTNINAAAENYHGQQPDFVLPALESFPVQATLDYFHSLGLITVTEEGGRVYPLSNSANSVLDVLRFALEQKGVELRCGCTVSEIIKESKGYRLRFGSESLCCDYLIVACGGAAGAKLGGVKDGYELLKPLGHKSTALSPSLVQLITRPEYPRGLKGIRCDCSVGLFSGDTLLAESRGELQFTDNGVSGPAAFDISRAGALAPKGSILRINFFRNIPRKQLFQLLRQRCGCFPNLDAAELFTGMLHNRLGRMLVKHSNIPAGAPLSALSDRDLSRAVDSSTRFELELLGTEGFDHAQVTAGGVKTSGFNPQTMESWFMPGLFVCGELLDVDGDCGGYNLQWAWSSGRLAGRLGK